MIAFRLPRQRESLKEQGGHCRRMRRRREVEERQEVEEREGGAAAFAKVEVGTRAGPVPRNTPKSQLKSVSFGGLDLETRGLFTNHTGYYRFSVQQSALILRFLKV